MTTDFDQFKTDISKWIIEWVSVYNENIKNIPCPFAKQALLNDNIQWDFVINKDQMIEALNRFELYEEIAVVGFNPVTIDNIWLTDTISKYNEDFMQRDLLILEDHPEVNEILIGEKMNQGKWGFLAIQNLSKLNKATKQLQKKGYYDNWPKENYDSVVSWRLD